MVPRSTQPPTAAGGRVAFIGWFDRDGSVATLDRDVWHRVLDVLSDDAAFITGIDLVVDGGWTLALA